MMLLRSLLSLITILTTTTTTTIISIHASTMPTTKQATILSNHLENGEWPQALALVRQVTNVQTLKSIWMQVWNSPTIPSLLVYSLLCRIKHISRAQGKTYPIGVYPFMFQANSKSQELWRRASVGTCRAFLRALSGTYQGIDWPQSRFYKEEINSLWTFFLGLPPFYSSPNRVSGNEEHIQQLLSVGSLEDLEQVPEIKSLWFKTVVLLKAYLKVSLENDDDDDNDDFEVLHAIAEVDCLVVVMWFALKLYPDQISTRDANGNLPLHIAATKPVFAEQELRVFHHSHEAPKWHHARNNYPLPLQEAEEVNMGVFLCKRFPQGATYMNTQGHVPLLVSLFTLPQQRSVKPKNQYSYSQVQELRRLQVFMEAAPQVLASRHFSSKLYPFQIAASCQAPLDTIYTLFRSDPSSLRYRNITKREADYERLLQENATLKQELREKNVLLQQVQEELKRYEEEKVDGRQKRARRS